MMRQRPRKAGKAEDTRSEEVQGDYCSGCDDRPIPAVAASTNAINTGI
jgi:hypothetical protein